MYGWKYTETYLYSSRGRHILTLRNLLESQFNLFFASEYVNNVNNKYTCCEGKKCFCHDLNAKNTKKNILSKMVLLAVLHDIYLHVSTAKIAHLPVLPFYLFIFYI